MVSPELLEELKMIIKEDYQVELSPAVLSEIGNTLVNFFGLLAKVDYENLGKQKERKTTDEQ
mgnify:CR=1 FL=1